MDLETAREILSGMSGMFAGQLDDDEREAFAVLKKHGMARDDFSGAAGLLGLSKVRLIYTPEDCDS
ncbi:hypothetical protein IWQ55_004781 [Labrenzia sp. EL_208]|nr:hypothetical protein [Labrenzia sp. EL_132]MBG6231552.1 hypothetical protein [Labrenzia sp. EL_208]